MLSPSSSSSFWVREQASCRGWNFGLAVPLWGRTSWLGTHCVVRHRHHYCCTCANVKETIAGALHLCDYRDIVGAGGVLRQIFRKGYFEGVLRDSFRVVPTAARLQWNSASRLVGVISLAALRVHGCCVGCCLRSISLVDDRAGAGDVFLTSQPCRQCVPQASMHETWSPRPQGARCGRSTRALALHCAQRARSCKISRLHLDESTRGPSPAPADLAQRQPGLTESAPFCRARRVFGRTRPRLGRFQPVFVEIASM